MDVVSIVVGSLLSSFFQVLFDRMAKPEFLNLFRGQNYDDRIVKKLKWKLLNLQAVLEDAEDKQSKNPAVKEWLDKLQEVVYQADDLLDEINTEALGVKVQIEYQSPSNQVSTSTYPSNFSSEFLKEIMPKLEEIVYKLEDFEQEIGTLCLMKEVESKKQRFRLPSTSLVGVADVYGRDADKENIIRELLSHVANRENVTVISIVGLGGVGKTTLAQFVYNDERVKKEFGIRAWVCVSKEYDAIRITEVLLKELNISFDSNESFNSLQVKLKQGLSMQRFLLVLDDVWNRDYNDWLTLSTPFNDGKEGSMIIVTTRDEKVASMMDNRHVHHLNPMSEEDCWLLFKKHALDNRALAGNLEFESIGKEIAKKCRGLPLAVKAVAGLLRLKESVEEWNEILSSDEWDQPNNELGILPSLRLSYTHLSSHLKRCFAYCAVFHKDYKFSKNEVILLWMANDLLEDRRSKKRLEDIGDEFIRELTFRSLFQQLNDEMFSMHDLVNDLAKFVAGKYFIRLEDHQRQNGSSIAVRHFSYLNSFYDVFAKFKPLNEVKFLRTFLPIDFFGGVGNGNMLSPKLLVDILPVFKSLRVLSLYGYRVIELPNSFAKLKQLRFLNLSCTRIERLPSWICTFYNLQSLIVAFCNELKEFPEDMEKLINLRYLDVRGVPLTKMPMQIGRLENLQFLSTFIVSKHTGSRIEELGKLCNLSGQFTISGLENVANGKDAAMAKMKGKKHIEELNLIWTGDSNDSQVVRNVLENLKPHSNIKHVTIKGYCGTRFSLWLEEPSFCHIKFLLLFNCKHCFCLPALGQLPSLKYLYICRLSKVVVVGQEFYKNSCVTKPFPCLKKLRIVNMDEWSEWYVPENGVFSNLEDLRIVDCPKLIGEFPKQLPMLRKLQISGCPKLVNSDGQITIFDTKADLLHLFPSLHRLKISRMPNLKEVPSSNLSKSLPRLERLTLEYCQHIVSLPIDCLPGKELEICHCGNLILEAPEITRTCHVSIEHLDIQGGLEYQKNLSLSWFPGLQNLEIWDLRNIEELSIPQGYQNLTSLQNFEIVNCDNLMSFPREGLPAPNLTKIMLWYCPKLESLPARMHILLPSLQYLGIWSCPQIRCFPEGGLPSSLQTLDIKDCERLVICRREWGLQRLPSLTRFIFDGTREEESWLPEDLPLPCTLRSLSLERHQNLKRLNYGLLQKLTCLESLRISFCPNLLSLPEEGLPASLSSLSIHECSNLQSLPEEGLPASLFSLSIHECSNLQSLPEARLPASLTELHITRCPLLKQRLEWEKGEDWPKVAHIPFIQLDNELIP